MRVTIIGAGRVGLTTALALDHLGHDVSCVDSSPGVVEALRKRGLPFPDPGLEGLIAGARLKVDSSITPDAASGEVVMVAVPTPPSPDGHADLSAVHAVSEQVAALTPDGVHAVLAIKSTVPPGTTAGVQRLVDDKLRQRGSSARIALASNPEFLRQGSALADTLYPDRIVVGADDPRAQEVLRELYEPIARQEFDAPASAPRPASCRCATLLMTRPVNAELIKYASNAFLATKLSFINEIGRLAEELDADISDIAAGVGLDHRIGPHYFQAGPGWGGPCLGKDVSALLALAGDHQEELPLLAAAMTSNAVQREHIVERLEKALGSMEGATIGILGLSFKAGTDDTSDSPALGVADLLLRRGAKVRSYDPWAEGRARRERPDLAIEYHDSPVGMSDGCDALVVMTEWDEFRRLPWAELARRVKGRTLLDVRNFLDPREIEGASFTYIGIGR